MFLLVGRAQVLLLKQHNPRFNRFHSLGLSFIGQPCLPAHHGPDPADVVYELLREGGVVGVWGVAAPVEVGDAAVLAVGEERLAADADLGTVNGFFKR